MSALPWPCPRPCLALITHRQRTVLPLATAVREAVLGGVQVVQVREPDMTPIELRRLAGQLRALTAGRALLIVHGNVEVAVAVCAEGVHLREHGPPIDEVRTRAGKMPLLIGRSVHSVEAARQAEAEGADYVQVGAIYATASHPERSPAGIDLLRAVRAAVALPVFGVGGITAERAGEVLAAGADGVAAIGALLATSTPRAAAQRLSQALLAAGAACE